eukprot:TRINITY_DN746_c0_g1_i1.p1 TRINITY_DN746_c0_g1~~TRINITY_DN746_c0_g1_i1.p1  ORF type:complete len:336 (-),score=73.28 TRINITY_DN746_c0_g1_i1:94-1101(-)
MAFSRKKKEKGKSGTLVKSTVATFKALEKSDNKSKQEKLGSEGSSYVHAIKEVFYPESRLEPDTAAGDALAGEILASDIMPLVFTHLEVLSFEARKDLVLVFGNLVRRKNGNTYVWVDYFEHNLSLLDSLVGGYENNEIATTCGHLLRLCIEYESLARHVLFAPAFFNFFGYVENCEFDVASDAFATFKDLLTKHKVMCADFLEKNYDAVFQNYTKLLHSTNYVTRRQSLKLLGELLLDRANFNVMTKYISEQENLKLMMNLLRDRSKNIQFEAFHVFKVFVANPNKARPILEILVKNKDKLIAYLDTFQNDKEDEQFADEKAFLLKQIDQLPSS